MRLFRFLPILCIAIALTVSAASAPPAPKKAWTPELIERLPESYREAVRKYATASAEYLEHYKQLKDDDRLLNSALNSVAESAEGAKFLAQRLKKESSADLRLKLVDALRPAARKNAEIGKLFDELIASDPSSKVSVAAADAMVLNERRRIAPLLEKRLAMAKQQGDVEGMDLLLKKDMELGFGKTTLADFVYQSPPVFAAVPATTKSIRVLAFGDFGTGDTGQISTAKAMRDFHQKQPFNFGLTMGDNFYPRGLDTVDSPRWKTEWEDLYTPMGVKFYPTLGNHDYGLPDSPAAELAYTQKSKSWFFPAPFYHFTAGPVEFFAIDTVRLDLNQLQWLEQALLASKAKWKVVYGHYQIFSASRGDSDIAQGDMVGRLLPVLKKGKADMYVCGHDHNMQELKPEEGVHFFIVGSGGAGLYDMDPKYPRSLFQSQHYGFGVMDFTPSKAVFSFVGLDGKVLHKREITK